MRSRLDGMLVQAQLVVAAAMTAIVWFVQRITYPQFLLVDPANFPAFHERYTSALTPIVAPLMIAELGLALFSAWHFRRAPTHWPIRAGALLVVALWLSTFLIQVPLHDALAERWSEGDIEKLVEGNWLRTVLWSARLALLMLAAAKLPQPSPS